MKHISLLTTALLVSTWACGSAVKAQADFPSTGIGAYSSAIEVPEALIQSLPSLPETTTPTRQPGTIQPAASMQQAAPIQQNVAPVRPVSPTVSVTPPVTSSQMFAEQAHGEVFSAPTQVQTAPAIESAPIHVQALDHSPVPSDVSPQSNVPTNDIVVHPGASCTGCQQAPSGQYGDGTYEDVVIDSAQFESGQIVSEPLRSVGAGPLFTAAQSARTLRRRSSNVFSTVGVSALLFDRNHGSNRDFSTNTTGDVLASSNAVNDLQAGIDVTAARRRATGRGWEARYFGLYPGDQSTEIGNNASTLLPGLSQIGTAVSGTGPAAFLTGPAASSFFNSTDTHVLTRNTELNNLEFNVLKNSRPRFGALLTEMLVGFRYFHFAETLLYEAVDIPAGDPMFVSPNSIGYFSSTENHLVGLQLGARSDYRLRQRIMMHVGFKVGAFNNNIKTRQRVDYRMADGSIIYPTVAGGTLSGQAFDIGGEDNVKSILGELDVALSVQMSDSARVRVGYRALGMTDIAFASDQIQDDFTDGSRLRTPYADGNLVTQGTYVGMEFAY